MSTLVAGRRSSVSSKAENIGARAAKLTAQDKKRVALGNLTNIVGGRASAADVKLSSSNSVASVKKGSFASFPNVNSKWGSLTKTTSNQFDQAISHHGNALQKENLSCLPLPDIMRTLAPHRSLSGLSDDSVSMEDDMLTCNSVQSPDLEYLDNEGSSVARATPLHCCANDKLHISDSRDVTVTNLRKQGSTPMEIDSIFDIDINCEDPQLCATLACDIYKNLREAETKKRPSPDYVKATQNDIDTSMRAVLIDWLVEVTEEYRLVPETLYLTVNYVDRYLSHKEINRHKLQLLGIACLLIAAKHEEICPPQVEELCYITDNTYIKDEVLQMEASILSCLKFEMTAPTAKCFLRRFIRAAQVCHERPALHLEFLASYIAELSLLEYSLLCYAPSLIAASSVFLANFILKPTRNPWNTSLSYHTQYKPSSLHDCVKVLHLLFRVGPGSNLPAIREKYSQHKYKFVAKKYCPPSIPVEFFQDTRY
ncbi:cyclin-A1-4-like [Brachypodium distachyon]|uniref:cyclin-A1-4-like n=1 Tax=Brachypodium distachyon TaxID=15368 RepID=UPI000234DFAF|nr:cyclin-A1-4-like [Brachypodium distachyon]|eukprot:XP_003566404.1 cyclin-A1-4-like [Brachypodium distachyon]